MDKDAQLLIEVALCALEGPVRVQGTLTMDKDASLFLEIALFIFERIVRVCFPKV